MHAFVVGSMQTYAYFTETHSGKDVYRLVSSQQHFWQVRFVVLSVTHK